MLNVGGQVCVLANVSTQSKLYSGWLDTLTLNTKRQKSSERDIDNNYLEKLFQRWDVARVHQGKKFLTNFFMYFHLMIILNFSLQSSDKQK